MPSTREDCIAEGATIRNLRNKQVNYSIFNKNLSLSFNTDDNIVFTFCYYAGVMQGCFDMFFCKLRREGIPLRDTLFQISRIAGLTFVKWELFFKAAEYIEQGASVFDALLMAFVKESEIAFSDKSEIISSDKVYEKFGFKVINLK